MGRRLAQHAEIIDRRHDPPAEQMLPNAIDHHPRHQRIVRGRPSARPIPSRPLPVLDSIRCGCRQSLPRTAAAPISPGVLWIAAHQQRLVDAVAIQHGRRQSRCFGNLARPFRSAVRNAAVNWRQLLARSIARPARRHIRLLPSSQLASQLRRRLSRLAPPAWPSPIVGSQQLVLIAAGNARPLVVSTPSASSTANRGGWLRRARLHDRRDRQESSLADRREFDVCPLAGVVAADRGRSLPRASLSCHSTCSFDHATARRPCRCESTDGKCPARPTHQIPNLAAPRRNLGRADRLA